MSYTGPTDNQLPNLLAAITDALIADTDDVDAIVAHYNVPREHVEGALYLIHRLTDTLVPVQPSRKYIRNLKSDLIGHMPGGIVGRVRYLPPRVQIAAGLTLLAGLAFLLRRRMAVESSEATTEVPALQ